MNKKKENDFLCEDELLEENSKNTEDNQNVDIELAQDNSGEHRVRLHNLESNLYDEHKIFILPSFTEGQPMSLLESLSRHRPVIIFKEIDHVIQNRVGIFISDRNYESLKNTISHIDNNYENIQEMIKKNNLPTLDDFINNLTTIILDCTDSHEK